MLTSTAPSAGSQISFGNPRQIATSTTTNSLVMYTVPAGKKFQGTIYNGTAGQGVAITPSGGSLILFENVLTTLTSASFLITLVAGSIVTSQSANRTFILGVETDA
jgi:hypothetical protein